MDNYDYNRQGDIIEITIRDSSHRKIESFKANMSDKKQCKKILTYIEFKYGFINVEIPHDKSINEKNKDLKDKNWLDLNNDFFK
jgi:hypothetical protein